MPCDYTWVPRRSGVIEGAAWCETCGWETHSYKTALMLGANHAKHTGHEVRAEQTIVVTYNPKPKSKPKEDPSCQSPS